MSGPRVETPDETTSENADAGSSASSFELFGRVVTGVVGAIEDGAELFGSTLREELTRFRRAVERRTLGGALLLPGIGLITAASVLVLQELLRHWAASLFIVGAVYLAVAFYLLRSGSETDSPEPIGRGGSPELNATGVGPRRPEGHDAPRHEPK